MAKCEVCEEREAKANDGYYPGTICKECYAKNPGYRPPWERRNLRSNNPSSGVNWRNDHNWK